MYKLRLAAENRVFACSDSGKSFNDSNYTSFSLILFMQVSSVLDHVLHSQTLVPFNK